MGNTLLLDLFIWWFSLWKVSGLMSGLMSTPMLDHGLVYKHCLEDLCTLLDSSSTIHIESKTIDDGMPLELVQSLVEWRQAYPMLKPRLLSCRDEAPVTFS